ncbi:MAG TPA: hypothetical protein VLG45_06065 [Thermodesulfobacteriota bacterium]|nr:hypothetical protein [Thermodesulfobacteriota bacterium]
MLRKIIDFLFNALAVKEFLIFTGTFFVLTAFAMVTTDSFVRPEGCAGVIPLELAFTKSAFERMLTGCGEQGVRAHLILVWIDYLFIIAYTGFLGNLTGSLVKGLERGRALTYFSLPMLAGALDVIENLLLQSQLSNPDNLSGLVIFAASTAAAIKFVLITIIVFLIAYYLFAAINKKNPASAS